MIKSLLDLFFPPLCLECQSLTQMPYLCRGCWLESCLIDPETRCIHCFEEMEEKHSLCLCCRKIPFLPFPRAAVFEKEAPIVPILTSEFSAATAGFAYYQWSRLDWKEPDVIVPIRRSQTAHQFAELMDRPCPDLLRRVAWPHGHRRFELREDLIDEEVDILLFDQGNDSQELQMACACISEAFPKRVYLLSLTI